MTEDLEAIVERDLREAHRRFDYHERRRRVLHTIGLFWLILLGTFLLKVAYVPRLAAVGSAGRPFMGLLDYAVGVVFGAAMILSTVFGVELWLMRRAFKAGESYS